MREDFLFPRVQWPRTCSVMASFYNSGHISELVIHYHSKHSQQVFNSSVSSVFVLPQCRLFMFLPVDLTCFLSKSIFIHIQFDQWRNMLSLLSDIYYIYVYIFSVHSMFFCFCIWHEKVFFFQTTNFRVKRKQTFSN